MYQIVRTLICHYYYTLLLLYYKCLLFIWTHVINTQNIIKGSLTIQGLRPMYFYEIKIKLLDNAHSDNPGQKSLVHLVEIA
jgi:hypothetical protein